MPDRGKIRVRTVDGEIKEIPRGDLDQDTWNSLWEKAEREGTDRRAQDPLSRMERGQGDYVEFMFHGKRAILPRGDISTEEWEKIKSQVKESGSFAGSSETQAGSADRKRRGSVEIEIGEPELIKRTAPEVDVEVGKPRILERKRPFGQNPDEAEEIGSEPAGVPQTGRFGPLGRMATQTMLGAAPAAERPAFLVRPDEPPGAPWAEGVVNAAQAVSRLNPADPMNLYHGVKALEGAAAPSGGSSAPAPTAAPGLSQPPPEPASAEVSLTETPAIPLPRSATEGFEKQIESATKQEAAAIRAAGDLESKRLAEVGRLQKQAAEQMLDDQAMQRDIQVRRQLEQESALKAIDSTVKQLGEVQKVDPSRLWNRMDTGNKILAGVGILLGGLGQGTFAALGVKSENEALKILDDAIRRDVEVQREAVADKREAVRAQLTGQRLAYDMLRQQGMDEIEAFRSEQAAKIQIVQQQIAATAMQMQSAEAKATADRAVAALESKRVQLLQPVLFHRDQRAMEGWKQQMQQREMLIKLRTKGRGKIPFGKQLETIDDAGDALKLAQDLEKQFAEVSGVQNKAIGKIPRTAASEFNAASELGMRTIAKFIDKSVLQKWDIEDWKSWWPMAGDLNGAYKLSLVRKMIEESVARRIRFFQRTGYSMPESELISSDLSPEEMQALGVREGE